MSKMDKKEAEGTGEFHFYYNRDERIEGLTKASQDRVRKRKGAWWKKNPGQAVTFLDIVVIALVLIVIFPMINYFAGNPEIGGYRWEGRGRPSRKKPFFWLERMISNFSSALKTPPPRKSG